MNAKSPSQTYLTHSSRRLCGFSILVLCHCIFRYDYDRIWGVCQSCDTELSLTFLPIELGTNHLSCASCFYANCLNAKWPWCRRGFFRWSDRAASLGLFLLLRTPISHAIPSLGLSGSNPFLPVLRGSPSSITPKSQHAQATMLSAITARQVFRPETDGFFVFFFTRSRAAPIAPASKRIEFFSESARMFAKHFYRLREVGLEFTSAWRMRSKLSASEP